MSAWTSRDARRDDRPDAAQAHRRASRGGRSGSTRTATTGSPRCASRRSSCRSPRSGSPARATQVCSVVRLPARLRATETKAEEAAHLVELGCVEVDMVINIAAFLEGEDAFVRDDIAAVVDAVATRSDGDGAREGDPRDRLPATRPTSSAAAALAVEAGAALREDVDRLRPARRERATTSRSCARRSGPTSA